MSAKLEKDLRAAQAAFEAARDAAERVANEEAAALASDDAWTAWTRQKKLADREVARLEGEIARITTAIEDDAVARQRQANRALYDKAKARHDELEADVIRLRDEIWPWMRQLLIGLAEFEGQRDRVNRLPDVPAIGAPDKTVRDIPSKQEEVIEDVVVDVWCFPNTFQMFGDQDAVSTDGAVPTQGGRDVMRLQRRKMRRITRYRFERAHDAMPLWKSLVMPRLDHPSGDYDYQFNGSHVVMIEDALKQLRHSYRPQPRNVEVIFKPADVPAIPVWEGPMI